MLKLNQRIMSLFRAQTNIVLSVSIIAIIFGTTIMNSQMFESGSDNSNLYQQASFSSYSPQERQKSSRGIASVLPLSVEVQSVRTRLNQEINIKAIRNFASIGSKPSALDRLAFGSLEGKYAIRLKKGKIEEIRFSDAQEFGDQPKYVNDRVGFIDTHRTLIPIQFKAVRVISQSRDDFSQMETYGLYDGGDIEVGKVHFEMDEKGRLIYLRVLSGKNLASRIN